jgi:nitrite reductase/ring-hydroxylating ferredoxin subunit
MKGAIMAEWRAGRIDEFTIDRRRLVTIDDGREVIVFQRQGRFYAFENTCLHMGGPVGDGLLIGKVEAVLGEDQEEIGERFSEKEIHLVCPWHGFEYDIETGEFVGKREWRLRKYPTLQRGEEIYVVA